MVRNKQIHQMYTTGKLDVASDVVTPRSGKDESVEDYHVETGFFCRRNEMDLFCRIKLDA